MTASWRETLAASEWSGSGELWLDPEGNQADRYDCEMRIKQDVLHYSWSYEGKNNTGLFTFDKDGANWSDSWHQPEAVKCKNVSASQGLFTVEHEYEVPENPNWGWRSKLSERPNGDLVLQMSNIAPWGEEGRAVRMVFVQK